MGDICHMTYAYRVAQDQKYFSYMKAIKCKVGYILWFIILFHEWETLFYSLKHIQI